MAFGDFTVTRASTKLRIGSNGLYGSVANNVPAFEFNANGSYRGLLVEPGATNLALRSQEFDDAYWSKVSLTVTANAGVSPDGATTADKLIPSTGAGVQQRIDRVSTVTNAVNTFSVYAKNDGYNFLSLRFGGAGAPFNLTTGAIGALGAGITAVSEALPNGWFRVSITGTPALNETVRINVESSLSVGTNLQGDGTSGVLLWQAQIETGAVATSPIVTTGSTANRVADVVSLTGASSLIGQTEGTLYAEVTTRLTGCTAGKVIAECRTDANNRFRIIKSSTDAFQVIVTTGGVDQASITSSTNQSGVFKVAFAYKLNDFAFYVNGVQIGTDVSGTVPTTNRIDIGATGGGDNQFNDHIRAVALFPTRLDNATLASITTP
jgi:hypothetical protein